MLLPRDLVFEDYTDIDEFLAESELHVELYKVYLKERGRHVPLSPITMIAEDPLFLFNEALYLCTCVLVSSHPEACIKEFEKSIDKAISETSLKKVSVNTCLIINLVMAILEARLILLPNHTNRLSFYLNAINNRYSNEEKDGYPGFYEMADKWSSMGLFYTFKARPINGVSKLGTYFTKEIDWETLTDGFKIDSIKRLLPIWEKDRRNVCAAILWAYRKYPPYLRYNNDPFLHKYKKQSGTNPLFRRKMTKHEKIVMEIIVDDYTNIMEGLKNLNSVMKKHYGLKPEGPNEAAIIELYNISDSLDFEENKIVEKPSLSILVGAVQELSPESEQENRGARVPSGALSKVGTTGESYFKMHPAENTVWQSSHDHFPPLLSEVQGGLLYEFLIKAAFIDALTDKPSFLYLMGCITEQPANLTPINWRKNKQLLRELLELAFKPLLKKGNLHNADIERLTPLCFKKNGVPYGLANRIKHPSSDSDKLSIFFATKMRGL